MNKAERRVTPRSWSKHRPIRAPREDRGRIELRWLTEARFSKIERGQRHATCQCKEGSRATAPRNLVYFQNYLTKRLKQKALGPRSSGKPPVTLRPFWVRDHEFTVNRSDKPESTTQHSRAWRQNVQFTYPSIQDGAFALSLHHSITATPCL